MPNYREQSIGLKINVNLSSNYTFSSCDYFEFNKLPHVWYHKSLAKESEMMCMSVIWNDILWLIWGTKKIELLGISN